MSNTSAPCVHLSELPCPIFSCLEVFAIKGGEGMISFYSPSPYPLVMCVHAPHSQQSVEHGTHWQNVLRCESSLILHILYRHSSLPLFSPNMYISISFSSFHPVTRGCRIFGFEQGANWFWGEQYLVSVKMISIAIQLLCPRRHQSKSSSPLYSPLFSITPSTFRSLTLSRSFTLS